MREALENEIHQRRWRMSVFEEYICVFLCLNKGDHELTVPGIASGIGKSYGYHYDELGYQKVYTRWFQ